MTYHDKAYRTFFIALTLVAGTWLFAACGGGATPCEEAGQKLCAEACACSNGAGCVMGDASFQITFDDQADCEAFMVGLGCNGDDGSLDAQFNACTAALDAPVCFDTGDGTMALESPAACNVE